MQYEKWIITETEPIGDGYDQMVIRRGNKVKRRCSDFSDAIKYVARQVVDGETVFFVDFGGRRVCVDATIAYRRPDWTPAGVPKPARAKTVKPTFRRR